MQSDKVEEAVQWYSRNRALYEKLAHAVGSVIQTVLDSRNINYHSVTTRAKTIERYRSKALKKEYKDPHSEIMDMAGVRVITYLDSEAAKVSEAIKESFQIIPEHSIDKSRELGTDRVGYRSIHFIATLGEKRCSLPENRMFSGLRFEIQIRSLLQHAWAEFEHDRNYKFKGVLPDRVKRRFAITAGALELIDREFDSIANIIDAVQEQVQEKVKTGDLSTQIDSTSLTTYLNKRFESLITKGVASGFVNDKRIVDELSVMGISTLEELNEAIPADLEKIVTKSEPQTSFMAILRRIMVIKDADSYFKKAWRQSWSGISKGNALILKHYGVDVEAYKAEFGFEIL